MAIRKRSNVIRYKSEVILPLTFFILVFFQSCAPKNDNPPPADLIERGEMTTLITDLTLSEAALAGEPLAGFNDTLRKINVLKEHHVTHERFLSSFRYYSENPQVLRVIYDSVIVTLERKKELNK